MNAPETIQAIVHLADKRYPDDLSNNEQAIISSHTIRVSRDQMIREVLPGLMSGNGMRLLYDGFDETSEFATRISLLRPEAVVDSYAGFSDEVAIDIETTSNGTTLRVPEWRYIGRNWQSFDQIEGLIRNGFLHAKPNEYVVRYVGGSGGGTAFFDLGTFLFEHGVDLGLGALSSAVLRTYARPVLRHFRLSVLEREARRVAVGWGHRGLLYPSKLRMIVDRRSIWDPEELGRRLTIHPMTARQLLRALGYAPNSKGLWVESTSRKPKSRRRKWLKDEDNLWFGSDESDIGYPMRD